MKTSYGLYTFLSMWQNNKIKTICCLDVGSILFLNSRGEFTHAAMQNQIGSIEWMVTNE